MQERVGSGYHFARAGISRRVRIASCCFILGVSAPAHQARSDGLDEDAGLRLGVGDRITVTVVGQPDLSGDLMIDGSGHITAPLIGAIPVRGMTLAECQLAVQDRLSNGYLKSPVVSVRIAEFRPLYVLGDVRLPGAYPFRYGSTVASAIALAGGLGAQVVQQVTVSDALLADERVRQLTTERRALRIRLARLEAQRDGKETFEPPEAIGASEGAKQITAIEREALKTRARALRSQIELLHSQEPRIKTEIVATNEQIGTQKRQLELVVYQLDQYTKLMKQGLGLQSAQLQLRLAESTFQTDVFRLTAQVSRLQMEAGELALKINEAEVNAARETARELQETRDRLRQIEVLLPSAQEIREAKIQGMSSLAALERSYSVSITRTRDGKVRILPAHDADLLAPGDVIALTTSRLGAASKDEASLR